MINKDKAFFQYISGDLIYIISPLTSQLWTTLHKEVIKYVGPVVIYKIIDPHNYLLMPLDGRKLRGLFKHKDIKTCKPKDESRECSKSSAVKTNYEYRFKILLES